MKNRLSVALFAISLLAGACTSQPTILPSRDLDRPADLTFVCMGAFTPSAGAQPAGDGGAPASGLLVSGRPMRECHPRQASDPPADAQHKTFAFMPQSSSGQLAVVDADQWKLVDLDLQNAGFNQLPVGTIPSQIAASDDGCRLVTANHGSCDLTLVDPSALMSPTLAREFEGVAASTGNPVMTQIVPHAKGGPELRVFPGEVAFVPHPTADMTGGQNLCRADWTWRALVTFPSCDLVALVDLPSGEIVDGAYVRQTATGFALEPLAGRAPVCASVDCTNAPKVFDGGGTPEAAAGDAGTEAGGADAGAGEAGDQDGGASEAGATDGSAAEAAPPPVFVPPPVPLRPGPIAIIPETGRAYVGLGNGDAIVALDVTLDHLSGWSTIPLNERPLGTSRLRLSIDQYGDKTQSGDLIPGRFIGNGAASDREYLYAVARDGSVRVVQVAHAPENECETNLDPLNLPPGVTLQDACIPAGPATASHRRPTALGPGIRLPSPAVDVTVADIRPTPIDQTETTVEGAHAWVLTASGNIYLVNIDPVLRRTEFVEDSGNVLACTTAADQCATEPEPPPNSIRNRNVLSYSLALDPTAGPPRVDVPPTTATFGPHVESIWTRGTNQNATALTALYNKTPIFFPKDPAAPMPQTWTITWEGALFSAPRLSGQVKFDQLDPGPQLFDPGSDFCRLGAQQGDLVTLTGCTNDTQCGLDKVCALGSDGTQGAGGLPITGLCLKKTDKPEGCEALLGTVRRYDVTKARPNVLLLAPHKDELVSPDLRPCTSTPTAGDGGADGGAGDGGDAGATDGGAGDGGADRGEVGNEPHCGNDSDPTTADFVCVDGHCVDACETAGSSMGCRAGRTCVVFEEVPGAVPKDKDNPEPCDTHKCYCADGPSLTDTRNVNATLCLGELLGYQVNVGRGFLVAGSNGIPRTEIAITDPADPRQPVCAPDPNRDVRTAVRIPMDAPHCATVPDNALDSRCNPDTVNSCPLTAEQRAAFAQPQSPTPAEWANAVEPITTSLLNTVRNTDGPNPCLFEGGPNDSDTTSGSHVHALFRNNEIQFMLTNLEQTPTGVYQIRFDVHGGFRPQAVLIPSAVEVTMPVRIFLGPVDALPQSGQNYVGELPYLFVVDQRSLGRTQGGGPTRGQLLRIHPLGYTVPSPQGYQPTYQDQAMSVNTFPIR